MTLEGSLQDMALSDLIRIFHVGAKSGKLLVRKEGEQGIIYVADGVLVDAVILRISDGATIATADEAVLQLFTWEQGEDKALSPYFTFCYDSSVHTRPHRLTHTGLDLVVEALRNHPEPNRIFPYYTITPETKFQLAALSGGHINTIRLDTYQWRVLSQIANYGHLRDIDTVTGMEIETAFRIALELLSIGLIEIVPPSTLLHYQQSSTGTGSHPSSGRTASFQSTAGMWGQR